MNEGLSGASDKCILSEFLGLDTFSCFANSLLHFYMTLCLSKNLTIFHFTLSCFSPLTILFSVSFNRFSFYPQKYIYSRLIAAGMQMKEKSKHALANKNNITGILYEIFSMKFY